MWVILLEKAWAKLHGSYARCEGGLPSFAMIHLLGTPATSFYNEEKAKDDANFWSKIKKFDSHEYLMTAASKGSGEEQTAAGIVSGHAYSLISVHEFQHLGKLVRLVKLRNPWGKSEW